MKVIYPLGEVILEDFSFHRQNSIVPFLLYISQGNPVGSIGIFMDYIWWINYNPQCALMSYFGLEGLKKKIQDTAYPSSFSYVYRFLLWMLEKWWWQKLLPEKSWSWAAIRTLSMTYRNSQAHVFLKKPLLYKGNKSVNLQIPIF